MSKKFQGKSILYIAILICALCVSFASPVFAAASKPLTANEKGIVVSTNWIADAAGQKILDDGGNAIDAAAAVGFALAVVHPVAGNIGGGGFAIIHLASGDTLALDYREMAPAAAHKFTYVNTDLASFDANDPNTYVARVYYYPDRNAADYPKTPSTSRAGNASMYGYLSSGVPGAVAGLTEMVEKYGSLPLKVIMQPAIDLAEKGFPLTVGTADSLNSNRTAFNYYDGSRKYFTKDGNGGGSFAEGDLFKQPVLAETLKRIAENGRDGFYKGTTADLIVADMKKYDGIITSADLENYVAKWREPAQTTYRGFKVFSMSPPSSGGTHIVQMLNTIENEPVETLGFGSLRKMWLVTEAMRYAYADRAEFMADTDFAYVPIDKLTSKDYGKEIYQKMLTHEMKAKPSKDVNAGFTIPSSGPETTHYSVVDSKGNAVAITTTINFNYGCKIAVDGAGFFMNDEMDDLNCVPGQPNGFGLYQSDANNVEPGKRPLSCMSPTIILRQSDNSVFFVTGSPGGSRILNTVLNVIINAVDHGMNVSEAVAAPRTHHQWLADTLEYERIFGPTNDAIRALSEDMNYINEPNTGDPFRRQLLGVGVQGDAPSVMVGARTGTGRAITAAHDPRTFDPPLEVGLEFMGEDPVFESYVPVTSVDVTPKTLTLASGATRTLTVSIIPVDATNRAITWSTSDSTLATVPNGLVTANSTGKAGTVTITAIGEGNHTSSCVVTISPVAVTSVDLSQSTATLASGASLTLTATVSPSNATSRDVSWSTSDNTLATVINGTVIANSTGKAGTVTITATAGGRNGTCSVTVSPVTVTGIALDSTSLTISTGASELLTAKIFPENATNKDVTWSTSDNTIATVTNGTVSANNSGRAGIVLITAVAESMSAACLVTVNAVIPSTGGGMTLPGGTQVNLPGGSVIAPDGTITLPENEGGTAITPEGLVISIPGGTVISPDGTITLPPNKEGALELPGADASLPGGTLILPDGTIIMPVNEGGVIVTSDGVEIELPGGTVIWPDGTIAIPPDKTATVTTADGEVETKISGSFKIESDETITLFPDSTGMVTITTSDGTKIVLQSGGVVNGDTFTIGQGGAEITYPDGKTKTVGKDATIIINSDGSINVSKNGGNGGCDLGFGILACVAAGLGLFVARKKLLK